MSHEDYTIGKRIEADYDSDQFYGIMQGLMRLADSDNLEKLKTAFPEQWKELRARYNAPGGLLNSER